MRRCSFAGSGRLGARGFDGARGFGGGFGARVRQISPGGARGGARGFSGGARGFSTDARGVRAGSCSAARSADLRSACFSEARVRLASFELASHDICVTFTICVFRRPQGHPGASLREVQQSRSDTHIQT